MMEVYFFKLDGCPHCDTVKAVLSSITTSYPNISIKEVEHNDKDKLSYGIQQKLNTDQINAYPELKLINSQNKACTYSGPRNMESILKWIKTNNKKSITRSTNPKPRTRSSRRSIRKSRHRRRHYTRK
jgi:hypothetical protein